MTPILEFYEERTPYGIILRGRVTLQSSLTIPNYKGGAIDQRKMCESYILSAINENFIRLRGYDKLHEALQTLKAYPVTEEMLIAHNVIRELIKELQEPQFELKGNAQ